ncbi:MAG: hypothetical protein QNL77_01815 [Akkermansiaceae bacterium]
MSTDPGQRQFQCGNCQGVITIPANLPPTTAPCPICGTPTTSPGPVDMQAPQQPVPSRAPDPIAEAPGLQPIEDEKRGAGLLWAVAGLGFVGLLAGGFLLMSKFRVDPAPAPNTGNLEPTGSSTPLPPVATIDPISYKEAREVLDGFLQAETAEERVKYIIGGDSRIEELRAFYSSEEDVDEALDLENFTAFPMAEVDYERGIFLLDYHRPMQFNFTEFFRPIATLEVSLKVEKPSLSVRSGALVDNFKMDAKRARAFFKKIAGTYKLDWDTMVQTQFRLFRDFTDFSAPGRTGVFRVYLIEDVTTTVQENPDLRIYRVVDAAHSDEDQITVEVSKSSTVGQLLTPFHWTDQPGKMVRVTTATVRLRWTSEPDPRIVIDEILCWEYLDVGGDPSNLDDPIEEPTSPK